MAAPAKVAVCGGFDGSHNDDWTGIRLETVDGWQFTPTYGPDRRPTIWNPAEWGGEIPRGQVTVAWEEIVDTYDLTRVYCDPGFNDPDDPTSWISEIEAWARTWGDKVFVPWQMGGQSRTRAVHAALMRFVADLQSGALTHDGCPTTAIHMANARKVAKAGDRYVLGKPSPHQKIDLAVTSVLAHEAACDARVDGWGVVKDRKVTVYR